MNRAVVAERNGLRVVAMDSISSVEPEDRGQVVVSASNGGAASAQVARAFALALVVCNDAGVGKDEAGIAGMRSLDADGIPALTAGHTSAEISDGLDTWEHGVVSYANDTARAAGLAAGDSIKEAVMRFVEARA